MRHFCFLAFFCFAFLFTSQVHAKRFTSQYTEFELPPGWECALEGTEWVCQSVNKKRQKEAIIILAAKIRGEQDDLERYMAYLKKTKTFSLPGGKRQVSEPKYSKISEINNHRWVDSLHLASEVPGFYTRYLATVKEDLGVAVTFSVAKDHYASYQGIFDKVVSSLRVFRQRNIQVTKFARKKDQDLIGEDTTFIPDTAQKFGIGHQQKKQGSAGSSTEDYLFYLLIAGVIGFLVYRRMQRKKKDETDGDGDTFGGDES